jgi:hypothetical protein
MPIISTYQLWTGYGFPGGTHSFLLGTLSKEGKRLRALGGKSWLSGSAFLGKTRSSCPSSRDVSSGAAERVETGSKIPPRSLRWDSVSIDPSDPVELHLASRLRESAVTHVAGQSSDRYALLWAKFVKWCGERTSPRCPLPASEVTVALFLQQVADEAHSFSVIKQASAAIAFFQKINLFDHDPTLGPLASFVRKSAMRRLGLAPCRRKAPFQWEAIVRLASSAVRGSDTPYCKLVVVTFCVVTFGGMCRYSDVASLRLVHLQFHQNGGSVTLSFPKRKNDQYRQGSKVTISASGEVNCCPVALLRLLCNRISSSPESFLFQGFQGALVRLHPERTVPNGSPISYSQYKRYLSQWLGPILGLSPKDFLLQFGTQSGRSGGASAAANAGIPMERWGQHGSWHSVSAQRAYMQLSEENILQVSRTIMDSRPSDAVPADSETVIDDDSMEVQGVPEGVFRWHN